MCASFNGCLYLDVNVCVCVCVFLVPGCIRQLQAILFSDIVGGQRNQVEDSDEKTTREQKVVDFTKLAEYISKITDAIEYSEIYLVDNIPLTLLCI